jgi:chloride channel protein, CIC family
VNVARDLSMTKSPSRRAAGLSSTIRDELADFSADSRLLALSTLGLAIGAASTLVAKALVLLIQLFTNAAYHHVLSIRDAGPETHHLGLWAAFVPPAGGLVIGLMARYGSEKIRGHGIPEALEAILIGESRMKPKVAILKPLSSAVSIGTGGPFGAEGPIIMTGGAVGSLIAQLFRLSAAERKTLLVAGAAAGMSAVFSAPVASILLAVELLLFEWKPRSFIPVGLAAVAAGALRVPLMGHGPIFAVAPHAAPTMAILGVAFGVGIVAGLCAAVATLGLYAIEDAFQRLPFHWMWWPAIGGGLVGIVGIFEPRVLGVGYGTIHALLRGELVGAALLGLLLGKSVAWVIALGSGTSGGVLAPLLIIGGALGAVLGHALPVGDPALWTVLSMAAMMAGTMRSPLTAMAFAVELTGDARLLPALLIACVAAEGVTVLLLKRSILTEKVARRGFHVSREYIVDPLELTRVGDVMDRTPPTIRQDVTVSALANRIAAGDPLLTRHQALPIVDAEDRLAGIITRGDVMKVLRENPGADATVLEAGERDLVITHPDETVREAVVKLLRHGIGRLPVVRRDDPRALVGYLGRANVMSARLRWYHSEHTKDRGWATEPAPDRVGA